MKIAFVLNSSGLYGANRSWLGLVEYLRERGIECFAILPLRGDIEGKLREMGICHKVIELRACVWYPGYIGAPFLVNLLRIPAVVSTLKKWDVDIIHTNNSNYDIGMIAALIMHKKHLWHVREVIEVSYSAKWIFPKMYKKLREKSDAVICVSQYTHEYSKQHFPNQNMKMIYNPYDIDYYNIAREKFAPNQTVTIIMAGVFAACKRQIDAAKAIAVLAERGIKNVRLVLAGNGEPKYIEEIEEYIAANHLEENVIFTGFVEDLRELRRTADVALCCSYGEALPRVVVEGMLGELLVIGAESGGISELIGHNERGLLYELENYGQLADCIEYAINNKEECRRMILSAKEYAVKNFELSNSGERVLQVYKELFGGKLPA